MKCVGVHATRSDEEQKLSKKIERNKTTSYIIVFWFFFRGNSFYFFLIHIYIFPAEWERGKRPSSHTINILLWSFLFIVVHKGTQSPFGRHVYSTT